MTEPTLSERLRSYAHNLDGSPGAMIGGPAIARDIRNAADLLRAIQAQEQSAATPALNIPGPGIGAAGPAADPPPPPEDALLVRIGAHLNWPWSLPRANDLLIECRDRIAADAVPCYGGDYPSVCPHAPCTDCHSWLKWSLAAAEASAQRAEAQIATVFDAIKHGDEKHQQWLREKLVAHFSTLAPEPERKDG